MSEIIKEARIDLEPGGLFGSSLSALFSQRVLLELRDDGTVTWRDIERKPATQSPVV